jgi:two-component sensor histidine kinase
MRRTIFTEVKLTKGDLWYHLLFWVIVYTLLWINFVYTSHNSWDDNYAHDGFIVANLTMISTAPIAYFHILILLPQTIGNQRFTFNFSMLLYSIISIILALFASFLFDYLYDFHFPFSNPFAEEEHRATLHLFGLINDTKKQNMYWSRNIPESFFNMYLLTGLVYIRKWFNSSEELREKNEAQRLEIEKMRLLKDTLSQSDIIHTMMNSFFAQTNALKDIAEHVGMEDKSKLQQIITLQEDIGKLQRFRYSLINDNEDLVLLKYELKALMWMCSIFTSKNNNIRFIEDIENVEDEKHLIVPGIISELLWNSYKHSRFKDKSKKIDIVIELAVIEGKIKFYVENPIGDIKEKGSNSGLVILQKRLNLEYGEGNYILTISNDKNVNTFIVSLELPIKKR